MGGSGASRPRMVAWAASSERDDVWSLAKMCERCALTVAREMYMRSPICGLVNPPVI